jgi:hypothetical protein
MLSRTTALALAVFAAVSVPTVAPAQQPTMALAAAAGSQTVLSGSERYEYRVLATKRTGTMQNELQEFGGSEVVTITRRKVGQ